MTTSRLWEAFVTCLMSVDLVLCRRMFWNLCTFFVYGSIVLPLTWNRFLAGLVKLTLEDSGVKVQWVQRCSCGQGSVWNALAKSSVWIWFSTGSYSRKVMELSSWWSMQVVMWGWGIVFSDSDANSGSNIDVCLRFENGEGLLVRFILHSKTICSVKVGPNFDLGYSKSSGTERGSKSEVGPNPTHL